MTKRIVVDSCVALKWFLLEEHSDRARSLLDAGPLLVAPDIVLVEIANGLWKNERLGRVPTVLAMESLAAAPGLIDEFVSSASLLPEAAGLARSLDHPVYDCLYVAAARKLGVNLVTTDAKLLAKLKAKRDRTAINLAKWKP